jgi:hypothetical protein
MANITKEQRQWKAERIAYLLKYGREWSEQSIKNIKKASFNQLKKWALANTPWLKIPGKRDYQKEHYDLYCDIFCNIEKSKVV